ncbi:hypothetical protein E2C01_017611 [Portunus trituberculatus]|uniref:Secreted protein n=1 Tax=Portunus trituberculatus TaxID=210409 RepID=A0A5B7DT00_PORTR|nr:hypothetical protein [Portunus trituberculatus]
MFVHKVSLLLKLASSAKPAVSKQPPHVRHPERGEHSSQYRPLVTRLIGLSRCVGRVSCCGLVKVEGVRGVSFHTRREYYGSVPRIRLRVFVIKKIIRVEKQREVSLLLQEV